MFSMNAFAALNYCHGANGAHYCCDASNSIVSSCSCYAAPATYSEHGCRFSRSADRLKAPKGSLTNSKAPKAAPAAAIK